MRKRIPAGLDASRPDPQILIPPDRFGIDEPQTGYGTVTRMAATESILQALPA